MKILDRIDIVTLGLVALLLGLAPFRPEPHLVEKLRMLFDGSLSRPIDVFDLLLHGGPVLLFFAKLLRMALRRS